MSKKTWGIIMLVLAGMGLLGGIMSGAILALGVVSMIGFFGAMAALVYFGIKFIKKG